MELEKYDKCPAVTKADITGVAFWGMHDDMSWLTGFRGEKKLSIVFDGQLQPKTAYGSVLQAVHTELHLL